MLTITGNLLKYSAGLRPARPNPRRQPRGRIVGMSAKSSRRLREFLATHRGQGEPYAVTLTVRRRMMPEEFRAGLMRWKVDVLRYVCLPVVWRVELQRRGVPHLHLIVWSYDAKPVMDIVTYWHVAMRQATDTAAILHGAHVRALGDIPAWAIYLAMHASKASQNGWQGRAWGVLCRHLIQRLPDDVQLQDISHSLRLVRIARRYLRATRGYRLRTSAAGASVVLPRSFLERLVAVADFFA